MTASTIVKWYCQHHLVGPQPNVTRIPTMCVECDVGMLGYKLTTGYTSVDGDERDCEQRSFKCQPYGLYRGLLQR